MVLADQFLTYVLPPLSATVAGGLVGLERELRGHAAGLRTHTLVSLSCALLMLAAAHQASWIPADIPRDMIRFDPARMAHGILTGIGFLCGGVIFRQGFSVHGLTTAASLWMAASLGLLYGVGSYGLASGGTVATLLVLIALRWVDAHLPRRAAVDVTVTYRRHGDFPESALRDLMAELGLPTGRLGRRMRAREDTLEFGTTLRTQPGAKTDELARRLAEDPRVVGFSIEPRDD
ncbi:MgtC/SapB family protein [Phenylobacterium sp.]|uniref:MgtC/SapB family protein n=1 Tax=Phenylobacterium sp. TaxID=1871053 RepID=UPI0025EA1331|nr:MgtC/SapB family protein [Phenylobacterium sp.]